MPYMILFNALQSIIESKSLFIPIRSLFNAIQVTIQSNTGHYSIQCRSLFSAIQVTFRAHPFFFLTVPGVPGVRVLVRLELRAYLSDWNSEHCKS